MKVWWLSALLLAASWAGCLGGNDADSATSPASADAGGDASVGDPAQDGQTPAADVGAQPTWIHGDWWTYDIRFDLGFGTLIDGPAQLVLYDTGGRYRIGSVDRNAGIIDTYFDTFFVGDLDTSLNPASFKMLDFPLEDGKSWSTPFTLFPGNTPTNFQLTAQAVDDAEDPMGASPGFLITGTSEDGLAVEYVYSPVSKWVTRFALTGDVQGTGTPTTVLSLALLDHGSSFEGSFRVITRENLYERVVVPIAPEPAFQPIPPVDSVAVPDGLTFMMRIVAIFGFPMPPAPEAYAQAVEVVAPDNNHYEYTYTGGGFQIAIETDEPALSGDWHVGYVGHGTGGVFVTFDGFREQVVEFTAASHANHM